MPWCVLAWLLGVSLLSAWHLGGWMVVQRLKRLGTTSAGEELTACVTRLARQMGLPDYELLNVTGAAHKQTFEVSCSAADIVTRGSGKTRRNAEQKAAESMLSQLQAAEDA